MSLRFVAAAALVCISLAAARAGDAPPVTAPPHYAPAPADPTLTPSRAIGTTHDCTAFYPILSRSLNEMGDVWLGYDLSAGGVISNVHLIKSSGTARLDEAALSCVREAWRNTPAMKDGVTVDSPGHQAIVRFSLSDPITAEDFFERGVTLDGIGQHALAVAEFGRALLINPNYAEAYRSRGKAYEALGRHDIAVADYARADALIKPH